MAHTRREIFFLLHSGHAPQLTRLPTPADMSFGRPPGFSTFTAAAPDRGSFPLDHEGECKDVMKRYLSCMKDNQMNNGKCRHLSKQYLECRMDKGLMEKDDMSNLGFHEADLKEGATTTPASRQLPPSPPANQRYV